MAIKDVIKRHGISLEELGRELAVRKGKPEPISKSGVYQIVTGNPTLSNIRDIADILSISAADLLAEADDEVLAVVSHRGKAYIAHSVFRLREIADMIESGK